MVAVTYGAARMPTAEVAPKAAAPRRSWLTRFYDALIESRMKSARREISLHAHLLPMGYFEDTGKRAAKKHSGDMPFGGW